jgi:hypothetical protein
MTAYGAMAGRLWTTLRNLPISRCQIYVSQMTGHLAVLHRTENYSPITVLMFWPESSVSRARAKDGYVRIYAVLI